MVRDEVLLLQYSEKIKSELIIAMKMLHLTKEVEEDEVKGANRMLTEFFDALAVEVRIAYNVTKDERFREVEDGIYEVMELIGSDFDSAAEKISMVMTRVTTCADEAYRGLIDQGIL
jgi:predicted metallo-beta-lactamase superfamily hydrolase